MFSVLWIEVLIKLCSIVAVVTCFLIDNNSFILAIVYCDSVWFNLVGSWKIFFDSYKDCLKGVKCLFGSFNLVKSSDSVFSFFFRKGMYVLVLQVKIGFLHADLNQWKNPKKKLGINNKLSKEINYSNTIWNNTTNNINTNSRRPQ